MERDFFSSCFSLCCVLLQGNRGEAQEGRGGKGGEGRGGQENRQGEVRRGGKRCCVVVNRRIRVAHGTLSSPLVSVVAAAAAATTAAAAAVVGV